MRHLFAKLLMLAVLLSFPTLLLAQDFASLTGVVTDTSGAVIPGANVLLVNPRTAVTFKATSNSAGSYTISNVTPGPGYKITFSRDGFNTVTVTDIYLNVAATRTQNVKMPVASVTQSVAVSAANEGVTLDTTDATVGNNFEVQFLNDLPIQNRDSPSALFTQQPGITLDGAVTGARVDQDNVTLDGLDVNDMATGNFGAIVGNAPVDSVQEFRGVTAGPLSSAGEGGGGQFDLVTRAGTNQFHGAINEYHRDTDLEANDWFNNNAGVARPPLIRNQFGGNVGGPLWKNKVFFFFDYNGRRDTLSNLVERTVPLNAFRAGDVSYVNSGGTLESLTPAQVAAHDPKGVGFDADLLSLVNSRYPVANDLSGSTGDLVNTGGFRFNAPFPYVENDYVGRLDINLTSSQRLFGRVTYARTTATQSAIQFPGDPQTFPFLDRSHAWVAGHTWSIGTNKVNQFEYGETVTNYNFPNTYNPTGITQYAYGGNGTGGTILSGAYASASNAQNRVYPIPVIKDDFSWTKGKHSLAFGGTFKYINPDSNTILDYNGPLVGLGGNILSLSGTGSSTIRPSDISTASTDVVHFDQAYALALGRFGDVSSTYNYNAQGTVVPQGTGSQAHYRYYETEIYAGDTWKINPSLTISYGIRWQNYTVPYEKNGIESLPTLDFNQLFGARLTQSAAGLSGDTAVPFVSYVLGGKANNAPGYFNPVRKNFAPRFAFAFSPSYDRKSVFSGGAGIIYDHTVVNAVQYQASQYSYLFQSSATEPFGITGDPYDSLLNDPRFAGLTNPPPPPTPPAAIKAPYTPFVNGVGTPAATPFGLANGGAFNEGVDKNLKTPYSIQYDFGFQHEFPAGFLLRATYVGRLGRRLLAQADANQLIDFPDKASGQAMSTAFANMETQLRNGATIVTPQPWFEDILKAGSGVGYGFASNTDLVARGLAPLSNRGDFADMIQQLAALGLLPANVGMGAQYSEDTYYTNKGFSSYNGLLTTLHKNAGHGLQFDFNYTWSHSIDNVSVVANAPAIGGYGFVCDATRPRECRGNSDFDVSQYISGNVIYELPFGRGRTFGATLPWWTNEVIGGWELSGLPSYHSGNAYFAGANAFVAGYANNAPAILTGSPSLLKTHINKASNGELNAFSDPTAAVNAYTGPVGLNIGARNNLRGPQFLNFDLGLGKTFPVYMDKVNLKFRADAFNAFNHPNFSTPSVDITQSNNIFGTISSTTGNSSGDTARVLQVALRLEF